MKCNIDFLYRGVDAKVTVRRRCAAVLNEALNVVHRANVWIPVSTG